jgi:hypothetical protein
MRFRIALPVLLAVTMAGCYHATIETGRTPGPTVVRQDWAMSFVVGLIPPPLVNVAQQCPNGVARVETMHSFLNGLVAAVTFSIVTPITIIVTCASGEEDANSVNARSTSAEDIEKAMAEAVERNRTSGKPIYINVPAI